MDFQNWDVEDLWGFSDKPKMVPKATKKTNLANKPAPKKRPCPQQVSHDVPHPLFNRNGDQGKEIQVAQPVCWSPEFQQDLVYAGLLPEKHGHQRKVSPRQQTQQPSVEFCVEPKQRIRVGDMRGNFRRRVGQKGATAQSEWNYFFHQECHQDTDMISDKEEEEWDTKQ